jgi:hypothetical protein
MMPTSHVFSMLPYKISHYNMKINAELVLKYMVGGSA